jgi:DNA-binding NarL/FixJ family response regulator
MGRNQVSRPLAYDDDILALRATGRPTSAIARQLGISERTVQRRLKTHGLNRSSPNHGKPITAERLAQIKAMLDDGCSHREIGLTLHVGVHTIRKYFPGTAWTQAQSDELTSALQKARWATRNYA